MTPTLPAQKAMREALKDVTRRAVLAEAAGDTETALKALTAVRDEAIRAALIIRQVERETRDAAEQRNAA
jgi:hypothetical protein